MNIAIASGKGGTGKTTLSTNLALYLSETAGSLNVVLADLDVEEPNSGLFFNSTLVKREEKFKAIPEWHKDKCRLCGQCQQVCQFHAVLKLGDSIMVFPELCHSCYACSELCPTGSLPMVPRKIGEVKEYKVENLNFVEGRLIIGEEETVPLIKQTLSYLEKNFPPESLFLIDSPPGTSCPVIETTRKADFVILVAEPTPFGFNDFRLAVETLQEMKKDFYVVINKDGLGSGELEEYCSRNSFKIIGRIPNSREIAEVYSKGGLLYREVPEFRKSIIQIADFILDYSEGKRI